MRRGYWRVVIRPTDFQAERIPNISDMTPLIRKHSVEMRGWDFPHVASETPKIGADFIEAGVDWEHTVEYWRIFQSGQLVHYAGLFEDWRDQSGLHPPAPQWKIGQGLGLSEVVFRFTEIYEFASRLALTPAGGKDMEVQIGLHNSEGRQLYNDNRGLMFFPGNYKSNLKEFPQKEVVSQGDLTTMARELAGAAATKLVQRFGMGPKGDLIQTIQGQLRK